MLSLPVCGWVNLALHVRTLREIPNPAVSETYHLTYITFCLDGNGLFKHFLRFVSIWLTGKSGR
jgi:hypothetical protein